MELTRSGRARAPPGATTQGAWQLLRNFQTRDPSLSPLSEGPIVKTGPPGAELGSWESLDTGIRNQLRGQGSLL